jgi:hypothetical protein
VADSIVVAHTVDDYQAFAALIREYWDWLVDRYLDHKRLIEKTESHQGLEDELRAVALMYGPPEGQTLIGV